MRAELAQYRATHQDKPGALDQVHAQGKQAKDERALWESMAAEAEGAKAELLQRLQALKLPRMTPGRAAIVKVLDTYRELNCGLSKIEVQKLAYFLQEAGGPLDLPFVKHHYWPYSDTLRPALNTMEGHFIRGLGDGVVEAEIEPTEDALAEAEAFIAKKQHSELAGQVDRMGRLIDGYQSSYGMELLGSVHWVATHEANVRLLDDAVVAVHAWNDCKRHLMKPEHIASAWKRLGDEGWLVAEQQPRAAL